MATKSKSQAKVPKLRFREFQGDWNSTPGGELFDAISDKDHDSDLPILAITQDQGAMPRDLIDFNISVTDKSIEWYKVVDVGDFIISLRSFQGGIEYSAYRGICSPAYIILRPKKQIVDYFFKVLFKTDKYITEMNRKLEWIRDWKMVSYKYFSEIIVNAPSVPEQEQIASFLSAVDEKMEKLKTKKSLLEQYKKWVMQKIFSREIRFRDENGKEFEDWKEKSLWGLWSFYRGHSYQSENVVPGGWLLVLRSSNIQDNNLIFNDLQFVDKPCSNEIRLVKNDIVVCMANWSKSLVGKAAQYDGNYTGEITVWAFCSIFRSDNQISQYLFQSDSYKKYLRILLAGTNISNLKNSDLEQLHFHIPSNEREQQKIVSFLSGIDQKIRTLSTEIDDAEKWKAGLLQQMFV